MTDREAFRQQYQGNLEPSERDLKLWAYAERYHAEAETYDRTVCTGPVRDGSIMPMGYRELAMVNSNAHRVRQRIVEEATREGFTREEVSKAITRAAAAIGAQR